MTDEPREQDRPPRTRLGTTIQIGWKAEEIVYTRYTYNPADPARTVFTHPGSYVVCQKDINAFIKDRLTKPLPDHVYTRVRAEEDLHTIPVKLVDIYVGRPCYVVIELDPALDWQFRKGVPGIDILGPHAKDNAELRHVMPNGDILGPDGPVQDGCRLLYFKATARKEYQHQTLSCRFERNVKGMMEPDQVDPDIPNDGGKFPFEPICPEDEDEDASV